MKTQPVFPVGVLIGGGSGRYVVAGMPSTVGATPPPSSSAPVPMAGFGSCWMENWPLCTPAAALNIRQTIPVGGNSIINSSGICSQ